MTEQAYLFPDEDKALMQNSETSVQERLFYGILAREGLRVSELLDLTWSDVDLERGLLTLDQNKTAEPRAWAMDPAVVRDTLSTNPSKITKHFCPLRREGGA